MPSSLIDGKELSHLFWHGGRWLHNQDYLDDYVHFFYRGNYGQPDNRFHNYSNWATDALYQRYLVTLDRDYLVDLLDDLIADYQAWEDERQIPNDILFWQYDVRDSMEESICGADKNTGIQNIRPPLNSYMTANARSLAQIALLADRPDIAAIYQAKFEELLPAMIAAMWDDTDKFFKVNIEMEGLCTAREAIGFIPWMFNLPGPEHTEAWSQLADPNGFWAPAGLTTAERRHPLFRANEPGGCEWDGPVWPFATSQTLTALANMLCGPEPNYATNQDYFDALVTYANSHQMYGRPYIGEYMDEITGEWIKGPYSTRSRFYNHSTFADLVINGLVGLKPREDNIVEVFPLVPQDSWDWFCLDRVSYHGHLLTIAWDRDGQRYGRKAGLQVYCDDTLIAYSPELIRITGSLDTPWDETAPTLNPMTWSSAPTPVDEQTITMTATMATDSNGVEYYFDNLTDPNHDSGWQESPAYTDIGLLSNTPYTYTVTARDKSLAQNTTEPSPAETAITF